MKSLLLVLQVLFLVLSLSYCSPVSISDETVVLSNDHISGTRTFDETRYYRTQRFTTPVVLKSPYTVNQLPVLPAMPQSSLKVSTNEEHSAAQSAQDVFTQQKHPVAALLQKNIQDVFPLLENLLPPTLQQTPYDMFPYHEQSSNHNTFKTGEKLDSLFHDSSNCTSGYFCQNNTNNNNDFYLQPRNPGEQTLNPNNQMLNHSHGVKHDNDSNKQVYLHNYAVKNSDLQSNPNADQALKINNISYSFSHINEDNHKAQKQGYQSNYSINKEEDGNTHSNFDIQSNSQGEKALKVSSHSLSVTRSKDNSEGIHKKDRKTYRNNLDLQSNTRTGHAFGSNRNTYASESYHQDSRENQERGGKHKVVESYGNSHTTQDFFNSGNHNNFKIPGNQDCNDAYCNCRKDFNNLHCTNQYKCNYNDNDCRCRCLKKFRRCMRVAKNVGEYLANKVCCVLRRISGVAEIICHMDSDFLNHHLLASVEQ